ncbi:sensor histidine kinase [Natronospora cellulosivora (SeqCode)]
MENDSLLKKWIMTTLLGAGAATLFSIFYLIFTSDSQISAAQIFLFIIFCGLISGGVGSGAYYLGGLLEKYKFANQFIQQIIVFLLAAIFVGGLTLFLISRYQLIDYEMNVLLLLIGIGGFFVSAIVIVIDHKVWQMRKKVLELEIENKYLEELTHKEILLEEATKNLIVTQERNKMARDLHDSISQGLHGIKYSVHSLRQRVKVDAKTNKIINHLEETVEETLKELRNMIFELKPSTLEEKGLVQALKAHCELFAQRRDIVVACEIEEINGLSPEQELAIYRIVQEAFTNIHKHSEADEARIILKKKENKLILNIVDNGKGFTTEVKKGNGLSNMKARVSHNNGKINIESEEGNGTRIEVEFDCN